MTAYDVIHAFLCMSIIFSLTASNASVVLANHIVCITIFLSLFLETVTDFFVLRFIGHQQNYIKNYLKII